MKGVKDIRAIAWGLMAVPLAAVVLAWPKGAAESVRAKTAPLPRVYVSIERPKPDKWVDTKLAMYEPRDQCYLGAYIDLASELKNVFRDQNSKPHKLPQEFESIIGKEHSIYFFYLGYGRDLPMDWVRYLASQGKFIQIALEPNDGLDKVNEDEYLEKLADDMRDSGGKIFLRFASEMNGPWVHYHGDPVLYQQKWKLVTKVMRERAPNVAMVWCPYAMPTNPIPSYYPGDDWVDWVGVNMYNVSYFNQDPSSPAFHVKPADLLQYVYDKFSARKPIMICEYGATHFSALEGEQLADLAVDNITTLYEELQTRFPRVKAVNYFNTNNLQVLHRKNNNYSVTHNPQVLKAYKAAVSSSHFIGSSSEAFVSGPGNVVERVQPGMEIRDRSRVIAFVNNTPYADSVEFLIDDSIIHTGRKQVDFLTVIDPMAFKAGKHHLIVKAYNGNKELIAQSDTVITLVHP